MLVNKKIRMRVPSDKVKEFNRKNEERGLGDIYEVIPVSLYGDRTMYPKGTDLKEVERDIQEVHGLK